MQFEFRKFHRIVITLNIKLSFSSIIFLPQVKNRGLLSVLADRRASCTAYCN